MNTAETLTLMLERLGNRKSSDIRAKCLRELNRALERLESGAFLPWFLEKEWTPSTSTGIDHIDLPSDFLMEVEEGNLRVYLNNDWSPIDTKVDLEVLRDAVYDSAGVPQAYAIFGEKLYIGPTPDGAYQLSLPYYQRSAALVDDATSNSRWLREGGEWLICTALQRVAKYHIRDNEAAADFKTEARDAKTELYKAHEARKHVNQDYKMEEG